MAETVVDTATAVVAEAAAKMTTCRRPDAAAHLSEWRWWLLPRVAMGAAAFIAFLVWLLARGSIREYFFPPAERPRRNRAKVDDGGGGNTQATRAEASSATPAAAKSAEAGETKERADDVWICAACDRPKPLAGPHLAGKAKVRSECWPCGLKRFFHRRPAAELVTDVDPASGLPTMRRRKPQAVAPGAAVSPSEEVAKSESKKNQ